DGNEAVIADGLTPGMRVVASGTHVLAPGQKVTVYQPKTPAASAPSAQTLNTAAPAAAASR
ncbi:MAG: efflux RND transporter periplasmic adaptor subunit, partial [Gammaproteobacteria bacterium]